MSSSDWNEIKNWLINLNFVNYVSVFEGNGFDRWPILHDLTLADFIQCGIKLGHAKLVLKQLNERKPTITAGATTHSESVSHGHHIGDNNNHNRYRHNNKYCYRNRKTIVSHRRYKTAKTTDPIPSAKELLQTNCGCMFATRLVFSLLGIIEIAECSFLMKQIKSRNFKEFEARLIACLRRYSGTGKGVCGTIWKEIKASERKNVSHYLQTIGSITNRQTSIESVESALRRNAYNCNDVIVLSVVLGTGLSRFVAGVDTEAVRGLNYNEIKQCVDTAANGLSSNSITEKEEFELKLLLFLIFIKITSCKLPSCKLP